MYLTVTVAFALVAFAFAVDDCGRTPVPPDETRIVGVPRIIPGDWGKAESGWLAQPL
jgi:hypothetical protein